MGSVRLTVRIEIEHLPEVAVPVAAEGEDATTPTVPLDTKPVAEVFSAAVTLKPEHVTPEDLARAMGMSMEHGGEFLWQQFQTQQAELFAHLRRKLALIGWTSPALSQPEICPGCGGRFGMDPDCATCRTYQPGLAAGTVAAAAPKEPEQRFGSWDLPTVAGSGFDER